MDAGVISKSDIWRVASLMIQRYGKHAELECGRRADQFAKIGDQNGVGVWRGVTRAVAELTNTTPRGTVH